jgi:hypothetical protein
MIDTTNMLPIADRLLIIISVLSYGYTSLLVKQSYFKGIFFWPLKVLGEFMQWLRLFYQVIFIVFIPVLLISNFSILEGILYYVTLLVCYLLGKELFHRVENHRKNTIDTKQKESNQITSSDKPISESAKFTLSARLVYLTLFISSAWFIYSNIPLVNKENDTLIIVNQHGIRVILLMLFLYVSGAASQFLPMMLVSLMVGIFVFGLVGYQYDWINTLFIALFILSSWSVGKTYAKNNLYKNSFRYNILLLLSITLLLSALKEFYKLIS